MKKLSLLAIFGVVLIFVMGLSVPALANPGLNVVPTEYDFGDVELGSSSSTIITIMNVGFEPLSIDDVSLKSGSSPDFSITSAPLTGAVIEEGKSAYVEVTYAPSDLGYVQATLGIDWTNGESGTDSVSLGGAGVEAPVEPVTIAEILEFFDASVDEGTLSGRGKRPRVAELRLKAMRKLLEVAACLIEADLIEEACFILERAYLRSDGLKWPWDFVEGDDCPELNTMILELMSNLDCE